MKEFEISLQGHSMSPLLKEGDKVLVEFCENVQRGEIYLLRDNRTSEYFIHRYFSSDRYKGDNNPHFDDSNYHLMGRAKIIFFDSRKLVIENIPRSIKNAVTFFGQYYLLTTPKILRVFIKLLLILINSSTRQYYSEYCHRDCPSD